MDIFEFSNVGIERHCLDIEASDTSINTQFDTMELEEDNDDAISSQLKKMNY